MPAMFEEYPTIPGQKEILGEIKERAHAELPFELGKAACQELFADFNTFIDLCDEPGGKKLVEAVAFNVTDLNNSKYFVEYRKPGKINRFEKDRAPGTDHKYIFHFGSQTIDRATTALGGALPAEMAEFLSKADVFYEAAAKSARLGAAALGLENIMFGGERKNWIHHLRLLHYIGDDPDSLGAAHFDRSVATLAVTESRSGLRGVAGNKDYLKRGEADYIRQLEAALTPIDHHEYVSKFFLGAGYNHLRPKDRRRKLPLLGHDIQNNQVNVIRDAAVFFMNPIQAYFGYTVPETYETGFADIIKHLNAAKITPKARAS
jgi:hypothetical protein